MDKVRLKWWLAVIQANYASANVEIEAISPEDARTKLNILISPDTTIKYLASAYGGLVLPGGASVMDKPDIHIIRKEHYRANKDYPCAWGHGSEAHEIKKGRHYVRIIWEDENGEFQHDHVCLDCWVKP